MWIKADKDGNITGQIHNAVHMTINDVQSPSSIFTLFSDDELNALDIYRVEDNGYCTSDGIVEGITYQKNGKVFLKQYHFKQVDI